MEILFVGGSYEGKSKNLNAQVCQNLYPVVDQQGGKSVLALYNVPGTTPWINLGEGLPSGNRYMVSLNSNLYFESPSPFAASPAAQLWFLKFYGNHNNIVGVDIPTFTYSICPDIAAFYTYSNALIDPNNKFYYIAGSHGIYVIDLPAGTINTFISFTEVTTQTATGIVMDRYNRILYALVYGYSTPNYIFKIDLTTHTIIDYGTPTTMESVYTVATNDVANDYIYVGGVMHYDKILISDFSVYASISGPTYIMSSVIDIAHDYAYFACGEPGSSVIQRLKLSTFTVDATCDIPTGGRGFGALGIDINEGFLYFIPFNPSSSTNPVIMYQISIASMTITQSTTIYAPIVGWADCLVIDSVHQKIYIGYDLESGYASIGRFDIASFTQDAVIDYDQEALYGVIKYQNTV